MIEAIRALMIGTSVGNHALLASVWYIGFILFAIPTVGYLFRKTNRK